MNGFEFCFVGAWIGAIVGWTLRGIVSRDASTAIVSDDELAAQDAARRVLDQTC